MSRPTCWLPAVVVLAGVMAAPARAQAQRPTLDPADLFTNKGPAAAIPLKSLDANWRRVTISGPAELKGGGISQLAGGFLGAMFGAGAPPTTGYTPPHYTQGVTTTLGGETFLVVYRPNLKGLDFTTLMQMGPGGKLPTPDRLTGDTALILTLVNVRSITSFGDIRPFNLQQELAESAKAAEDEEKLIKQMQQAGPGGQAGIGGVFDGPAEVQPVPVPDRPAASVKKPAPKKK